MNLPEHSPKSPLTSSQSYAELFLTLAAVVLCYDHFMPNTPNTANTIMGMACLGLSSMYRIEMSVWNRAWLSAYILALTALGINGWN